MRYLFFSLLFSNSLFSQSLSIERVKRIKAATVQVIVEDGSSSGTGFFIDEEGNIATCWHVIDTAAKSHKKIFIRFNDGDTAEVLIANVRNSDDRVNEQAYDHCILTPLRPLKRSIFFLRIGNFNAAEEGEEVYTCGYPLGYPQQFISRGIISTKFIEDLFGYDGNRWRSFSRNEALLDLTLNRGNSGGAIVKIGREPAEDSVIGIADFVINPLGNKADSLVNSLKKMEGNIMFNSVIDASGKVLTKNDPNEMAIIFSQAIGSLSIGVSGCISVNYLRRTQLMIAK